jgi:hypothetical protein
MYGQYICMKGQELCREKGHIAEFESAEETNLV